MEPPGPATGSRRTWTSSTTDDSTTRRLLDIGLVVKPHGLGGDVVVDLWSDQADRLAPSSELLADGRRLRVAAARPHQGRYLVRFEGVASREAAEVLRGQRLQGWSRQAPGVLWVHELVGAEVRSVTGRLLGRVESVEPNPASDLLVLEDGGLVPLTFVVDHVPGTSVTVDLPEGLLAEE